MTMSMLVQGYPVTSIKCLIKQVFMDFNRARLLIIAGINCWANEERRLKAKEIEHAKSGRRTATAHTFAFKNPAGKDGFSVSG